VTHQVLGAVIIPRFGGRLLSRGEKRRCQRLFAIFEDETRGKQPLVFAEINFQGFHQITRSTAAHAKILCASIKF
jgi:hypothetical protein